MSWLQASDSAFNALWNRETTAQAECVGGHRRVQVRVAEVDLCRVVPPDVGRVARNGYFYLMIHLE